MTPEIACTSNFQTPPTPRKSLKNIFSVQQHTFRRSRTLLINSRRHYELTTPCVSSSLCTCFSVSPNVCRCLSSTGALSLRSQHAVYQCRLHLKYVHHLKCSRATQEFGQLILVSANKHNKLYCGDAKTPKKQKKIIQK